ncbi:MAG TPA: SDR family oxidoreductase [Chthoniobacterales bacterium]|nr:SDR family oxidoreductase [Chthoniobacterales bacterium]
MNNETTLITGASSGIGMHLAHEFARNGHRVILVAPVESELREVAQQLQTNGGGEAIVIAKDLEQPNAPQEIFDELQQRGVSVDILVNNAGHGQHGNFWEIPLEKDLSMMRLNMEAMLRLMKLFLPPMLARKRGRILNNASVGGFEPGPMIAVYHATKAFVLSLTQALATELEDSGITVTALCPGPTDTDFFPKADMMATRAFQHAMPPQDVAKAGYDAVMKGDRLVVPGGMNKALVFARRFMTEGGQAKMNEKMMEELAEGDRKYDRGDMETKAAQKD